MDIRERIKQLSEALLHHQYLYYVKAQPIIEDIEYDRMYDELVQLEKKYPQFAMANSPTRRVGSDLDNTFPEKRHTVPVLSLDKEYTLESLNKWLTKTVTNAQESLGFVVEEKIDGASIVLYYKNGNLDSALTRGNGIVGNEVIANVRTIKQIPLRVDEPSDFAVRGEIYINKSDFLTYNQAFENKYANPRNLAAGSMRNIKSSIVAHVPLNIFNYEGYFSHRFANEHILVLSRLKELGFRINKNIGFFCESNTKREWAREKLPELITGDIHDLPEFVKTRMAHRETLDYEIDGLVIKVDELDVRESLGFTAHHPRWAIAFKFDAPMAQTRLLDIEIHVGRNGRVTPVAVLEPIRLSGSVISRATLHNQEYIDMLELGLGDTVSISRRGDVIPAVEEVTEKNLENPTIFKFPETCPFCSSTLQKEGAHHFCNNRDCPERIKRQIIFFASKGQMDIDTLGDKTITFLYDQGFINGIPDLYTFDYKALLALEGFKDKKVGKIIENVENSKKKPFHKVLTALGFDGIGTTVTSYLIRNGYDSVDQIIRVAQSNDVEAFSGIPGFGDITARLLIRHFTDERNLALIDALKAIGLNFKEEKKEMETIATGDLPFTGQTWVITGSFEHFSPRSKAGDEIEKRGGTLAGTVTSKTTHLLTGESPGSKLDKAMQLGIAIINEAEFMELLKKG
ncbi:MAG: NAD-dependent DNA ligase LigA [Candidatus Omnitrophota bacterium]